MTTGQKYFTEHYALEIELQKSKSSIGRDWLTLSVGDSPDEALYRHREKVRIEQTAHLYLNKNFRMVRRKIVSEAIWYINNESERKDVTTIAMV